MSSILLCLAGCLCRTMSAAWRKEVADTRKSPPAMSPPPCAGRTQHIRGHACLSKKWGEWVRHASPPSLREHASRPLWGSMGSRGAKASVCLLPDCICALPTPMGLNLHLLLIRGERKTGAIAGEFRPASSGTECQALPLLAPNPDSSLLTPIWSP